jgi:hypothetical protein
MAETVRFSLETADGIVSRWTARPAPFPTATYGVDAQNVFMDGTGPLFYLNVQSGFDRTLPTQAVRSGLEIHRDFMDDAGDVLDTFTQGQEVTVRLRIRSLKKAPMVTNVAIVDLLPGGFEVIRSSVPRSVGGWQADYVDVREDRVIFYGSVETSVRTLTYRAKVTASGVFTVPPALPSPCTTEPEGIHGGGPGDGDAGPMKRGLIITGGILGMAAAGYLLCPQAGSRRPSTPRSRAFSTAHGRLLRLALAADDRYRLHCPWIASPPGLIEATLLYEDKDFYRHPGVDLPALARAFWTTYIARTHRVGASTITMQVARLRWRIRTGTPMPGKLQQILRALQLTRHYEKDRILEAYLNLAPYGGNIEGVQAASRIYFNKPPTS